MKKQQEEIIEGTAFVEALNGLVRVVIILPPNEDESTIYWYYNGERYESTTIDNRDFVDMTRHMGKSAIIGLAAHIAGIAISEGRW